MGWAHLPWRLTLTMLLALSAVCAAFMPDAPSVQSKWWLTLSVAAMAIFIYSTYRAQQSTHKYGHAVHAHGFKLMLGFMLLVLLSFSWAQYRWLQRSANELPAQWNTEVQMMQLRIASMPTRTDYGWRMLAQPVSVQRTITPNIPAQLSLSWADDDLPVPIASVRVGQVWLMPVHVRTPHASRNEGVFDQNRHWLSNNITALAYVRVYKKSPPEQMPKLIGTQRSVYASIENWRFDTLRRIDAALSERSAVGDKSLSETERTLASANVFKALALGDQASVTATQWQLFQDTGVTHLVSISGLHVTALAGLLAWCAARVWRRSVWLTARVPAMHVAQWVGLLGAWAYALIAGWGLPAQRTVWMLALWLLLARLGVARSGLRVLGFSVLCVLILDPFAVLSVGFWLSYGAVAWLIAAFDAIDFKSLGSNNVVHALKPELQTEQPSKSKQLTRWGVGLMGAQLGISLSLLPMTLYFFSQVSLLGVPINFIAIPLMSVLLIPLLLSVLVLAFTGWGAPVRWINDILMFVLERLSHVQNLSRDFEWVGRIDAWQVIVVFACSVVLVVLVRNFWQGAPRWSRAQSLAGASGCVLLIGITLIVSHKMTAVKEGQLRVTVLDVGQGSAVLLQSTHQNWLYDAGAKFTSEADAGARIIVPHLRYMGVRHIDTLVLSHNDADHTGGARSVLAAIPVDRVLTSLNAAQLEQIGTQFNRVQNCLAGQIESFDGVRVVVLSPDKDSLNASNTPDNQKSCVLRFSVDNNAAALSSIMLTGDMDMLGEAKMVIDSTPNGVGLRTVDAFTQTALRTDIVVIPHHGSDSSSSAPFIQATRPKWAVAQVGMYNPFNHPREAVLQRYRDAGAQIWRTDTDFARVFVLGE